MPRFLYDMKASMGNKNVNHMLDSTYYCRIKRYIPVLGQTNASQPLLNYLTQTTTQLGMQKVGLTIVFIFMLPFLHNL